MVRHCGDDDSDRQTCDNRDGKKTSMDTYHTIHHKNEYS